MYGIDRNKLALIVAVLSIVPGSVHAATLYLAPSSGTYEVGDRIIVQALVSGDQSLNAVAAVIRASESLSVESVSKANSILNFWAVEPSVARAQGTVQFEGVSLTGFTGSRGVLVNITLRAQSPGAGSVQYSSGQVLANDGQGTDITEGKSGATFTIVPATEKPAPKVEAPATQPKVEPKVETPSPSVVVTRREAPEIFLGTKDGRQAILGTTGAPSSDVVVSFVSRDSVKVFVSGKADGLGSFVVAVPRSLKSGTYTVTAYSIFDDGEQSDASNSISVEIGTIIYGELTWKFAFYLLLALLLLLLAIILYLLTRRQDKQTVTSRSLRNKVRDVERVVQKSFTLLRQDVSEHAKAHRKNKTEQETLALKQDLDDAESVIEDKLDDLQSEK